MKIIKNLGIGIATTINFNFKAIYIKDNSFVITIINQTKNQFLITVYLTLEEVKNQQSLIEFTNKYQYYSVKQKHCNSFTQVFTYLKTLFSLDDYLECQKIIISQI